MPGRRNKLKDIVSPKNDEIKAEVADSVEEVKSSAKSPLKEVLDDNKSFSIVTEDFLMEIDYKVLMAICDEMGYEIPEEGKNTNKKIRTVILENGGLIPSRLAGVPDVTNEVVNEKSVVEPIKKELSSRTMVSIEKSVTKNMGDYNSARVSVGIELPIDYTEAELESAKETMKVAISLVDTTLEQEVDMLG